MPLSPPKDVTTQSNRVRRKVLKSFQQLTEHGNGLQVFQPLDRADPGFVKRNLTMSQYKKCNILGFRPKLVDPIPSPPIWDIKI